VALKPIKAGMDTWQVTARFEAARRLVQPHDGWGKQDVAAEWRQKLDAQTKP
jgi:hypothetical protein